MAPGFFFSGENDALVEVAAIDPALRLFIVSPHAEDFDGMLGIMDLIHETMLDIDPA